jgi:hypothetical protein
MGLGERRLQRSIDLGRCRWPRETPRRNAAAKAVVTEREVQSPEGRIPRALHPERWVGGEMGSKTPREWKLRRRKVPGEENPGEPDPFHRKRCRERNPRRGTVGRVSGRRSPVRYGPWRGAKTTGGRRRQSNDHRRRDRRRNTRWTTSREGREGRTGSGEPMGRYASGQQHSEGHVNPMRGRRAAVTPRRHPGRDS